MRLFESSSAQSAEAVASSAFVPAWVKDAIFYQIFPERFANGDKKNDPSNVEQWGGTPKSNNFFGGDLKGVISKLDYISSLGVNCLYFNPIFSAKSNHKYDTRDYLKIDPAFGDEKVFKQLVDECHKRGIKIILDGVFNHTGVDFFAFDDVRKNGKKSKYVKWYNIYSFPVSPPNKPNYECWWNFGSLPKLMSHNPEVRDYLFKVTEHWMKLGIDGWRLDVPNEIPHLFWIEWRKLVKRLNPDAYIVGEIWDDATPWLKGDQFDAVMNYRFRNACLDFFANKKTTSSLFDAALSKARSDYPADVKFVLQNLVGSHDTERLLTLCNNDKEVMKLIWFFQMTYVGAPMIYYGDEIGMSGGKDPACRGTMVWDEAKRDNQLLATMQEFIRLRKENVSLRRGSFSTLKVGDEKTSFAFAREYKDQTAIVILNNGSEAIDVAGKELMKDESYAWRQVFPADMSMSARPLPPNLVSHSIQPKSGMVFIGEKRQ